MTEVQHTTHHPSPKQYVRIAILLAALTAIEVAMFYINGKLHLGLLNAAVLLVLAALKFTIVVGWYMHLRFEKSTLSRFFTFGFVLACTLYAIVLATFGVLAFEA
ncbi:MAG TPA: cytochrome C oxidase subunit IV family protein [Acidimicrobiia bacterium]|jgi:cytochrome c oxidase subunit 4